MNEDLLRGLGHGNSSVRLRAAMAAGTTSDPRYLEKLVERCAVEPHFFVREALTWALARLPAAVTIPRLVGELRSDRPQARSQALHTLSKIGDRAAWPAITPALLTDADDEVARSSWRAAVALVPEGAAPGLARVLSTQLGRGGRDVRLSLSRALIALGEAAGPALRTATTDPDPRVRIHAIATDLLSRDPESDFDAAMKAAAVEVGAPGRPC